MSEEQARKLIKEEFMNNVMINLDSALIFTYIQNLEQRIDKAIEYIKESEEEYGYLEDCEKTILEILKGGNNE